jgi:hypothetical protein
LGGRRTAPNAGFTLQLNTPNANKPVKYPKKMKCNFSRLRERDNSKHFEINQTNPVKRKWE